MTQGIAHSGVGTILGAEEFLKLIDANQQTLGLWKVPAHVVDEAVTASAKIARVAAPGAAARLAKGAPADRASATRQRRPASGRCPRSRAGMSPGRTGLPIIRHGTMVIKVLPTFGGMVRHRVNMR